MDPGERLLCHQIHPLKLATDFGTAAGATFLFWRHHMVPALVLGFVPPIAVSILLLRWARLEPYRASPLGRYVATFMTRRMELARFVGLVPLWAGAWRHSTVAIVVGVGWILGCWLWGILQLAARAAALQLMRGP